MSSIILTGGGTAGHCTPHLALLPYLKNTFNDIYYIGSENGLEKSIIEKENIPYFSIPCAKLKRGLYADNLKIPFTVIKGINKAKKIIQQLKPNVIFSKGGYVALPVVIAANKKVPVISHESDYTMGLANKISSNFCQKIITSFPETEKNKKNVLFIGSPIRNLTANITRENALNFFGFNQEKPVLLVMGGSLGAKAINDCFYKILPDIINDFQVIHICGKGNLKPDLIYKGFYQAEFLQNMGYAYKISSVIVSRAGANSLFEILNLQIPSVIIPLPKGVSRGDQVLNARYFNHLGLCNHLQQDCLSANSLTKAIYDSYSGRFFLKKIFAKNPVNDKSREISLLLASYAR